MQRSSGKASTECSHQTGLAEGVGGQTQRGNSRTVFLRFNACLGQGHACPEGAVRQPHRLLRFGGLFERRGLILGDSRREMESRQAAGQGCASLCDVLCCKGKGFIGAKDG